MGFKNIILFVALLSLNAFASKSALSSEKIYVNPDRTEYLIQHSENEMIYVEKFVQKKADGFQDLVWQRRFSDLNRANAFVAKYSYKVLTEDSLQIDQTHAATEKYLTEAPDKVLWRHQNNWSWDWEVKYSQWVRETIHQDFLVKYNIKTDCADLAYISRWIFARIHSLPAANRLGGSSQILSNFSMRSEWLKLSTNTEWYLDKRFLAALDYLMNNTYTHTLSRDSYPIAITATSLIPGTHHLVLHGTTGHTMFVYQTLEPFQAPVKLYYSNVPRIVRPLYESSYYQSEAPKKGEGFLRMMWPIVKTSGVQFTTAKDSPFYSEEQYDPKFGEGESGFDIAVMKKLNPDFSWKNLILSIIKDVGNRLNERIPTVEDGFNFCKQNSCSADSQGFDDWSTPSRDERLVEILTLLSNGVSTMEGTTYSSDAAAELKNNFVTIQNEKRSLAQLLTNFKYGNFSSDPNVPVSQRWGLTTADYFENLKAKVVVVLKNRKAFLAATDFCKTNCAFGSAKWLQSFPVQIDRELKTIFEGVQLLKFSDPEKFQQLKMAMDSFNIENRSLTEWSSQFPILNSDPRFASDFIEKKGNLRAALFPMAEQLVVSNDHRWAFLQKSKRSWIQDLKSGTVLFEDSDAEGTVADFDQKSNLWLTVLVGPSEQIYRIFQNDKQLIGQFKIAISEKVIEAKLIQSVQLGTYVLIRNETSVSGRTLEGKELFTYRSALKVLPSGKRMTAHAFADAKQICLFENEAPDIVRCEPADLAAPDLVLEVLQNDELVRISIRPSDFVGVGEKLLLYSIKKNAFLPKPHDVFSFELLNTQGAKITDFVKNESYLVSVNSAGDLLRGPTVGRSGIANEISKNLILNASYDSGSAVLNYFELKGEQFVKVNLLSDERLIMSGAFVAGQHIVLTASTDSKYRLRYLHGPVIAEFKTNSYPTLSEKNGQIYLNDQIEFPSDTISLRLNYVAKIKLQSLDPIQLSYTDASLVAADNVIMSDATYISYSVIPDGFLRTLSDRESTIRKLLGLASLGVYVYEENNKLR